ncbi:hypothetical protein Tco_0178229, partial [Tanacetum coccineum]
ITTFRNALRAQYLPHSSMYVPPPSITTVRLWFAMIGYNGEIGSKGTLKKSCLPPKWRFIYLLLEHMAPKYDNEELIINPTQVFSVHNWILKPNQPEEPPFTDQMKAICNLDVHVDSKAPKYSSPTEEDMVEGTKNHSFDPIFAGSNPSILIDKTKYAGDELKTATLIQDVPKDTSVPHPPSPRSTQIQELMAQVHLLQSQKKELEHQKAAVEAETESLKAKPSYPDINQLTTLLVTSLKPELAKLLASHDFSSCLPTELKELPSKVTELSEEIKELKQHVKDMELELPGDLK